MLRIRGIHFTNIPTSIKRAFVKGFSGNQNYPLMILPLQDFSILLLQIITHSHINKTLQNQGAETQEVLEITAFVCRK